MGMRTLRSGDQIIEFDDQRTRNAYAQIPVGGAEECGCADCLRFAAHRDIAYPQAFRDLLQQIGIDFRKEKEIYIDGVEKSSHTYEGWFEFAGRVIEAGERLTTIGNDFWFFFRTVGAKPETSFALGNERAAIEFHLTLPGHEQASVDDD